MPSTSNRTAVYGGALGSFTSHAPAACSTNGGTSWTLTPSAGSRYYLIAPLSPYYEGSLGLKSNGIERPTGTASCLTRLLGTCP